MKETKVASRYAKSLLDLALEKNVLKEVFADMKSLLSIIEQSRDFNNLLHSPIVKTDKKTAIFTQLFQSSMNPLTIQFLVLMAKKRRENILANVAEAFVHLYDEYKGIQKVVVTTAKGLDDTLRKKVMALVQNTGKSEIELVEKMDPSIIGGFILKIGDQQVDSSIIRSIKNLKREFTGGTSGQ